MMISLILSLLTLTIIMALSASSPLILGCSILLLTLLFCCLISFFSLSWFALLLFLIYVGGLLVMFAYFVALSPNQYHLFFLPRASLFLLICLTTFLFLSVHPIASLTPISSPLLSTVTSLFSPENMFTLIFSALVLFVTLLAVVKIVELPSGPLRPFLG